MTSGRKRNTENREPIGWVDLIVSAWVVLAGLFSLVAMVAIPTGVTEVAFRCAFMVLLIGCVASAALRLTRRLQGVP